MHHIRRSGDGSAADDDVLRAADLYEWGVPLVAVHRTRRVQDWTGMRARAHLATAADRDVVAPNNDTLYASGWFDLSAGDVTVEVPPMDRRDRYWSVMLLDAYTYVSYVSRRHYGPAGTTARIVYDPTAGPWTAPPATAGRTVRIATPTVWVLIRVLVDGPDDLAAAGAVLGAVAVDGAAHRSSLDPAGDGSTATAWFADLAAAVAADPPAPWHPRLPADAGQLLRDPPGEEVLAAARQLAEQRLDAYGLGLDAFGNGWGTRRRGAAFADDVRYRAAFARRSLAGHLPAENRSYHRLVDGSRWHALRLLPGEPPVAGFWSLTVYGADGFLVANPIDRYSIGDRTPGLVHDADGGLTITIGHDPPPGPTANWLPAPAGPCVLSLRAYEGAPDVVDATWFPPDVEPVAP